MVVGVVVDNDCFLLLLVLCAALQAVSCMGLTRAPGYVNARGSQACFA